MARKPFEIDIVKSAIDCKLIIVLIGKNFSYIHFFKQTERV